LATAVALSIHGNTHDELQFSTLSGILKTMRKDNCWSMEFPRQMPVRLTEDHYSELENTIKFFDLNDQTDSILICEKRQKLYIRLKDEIKDEFISSLSFNPKAMKETHHGNLIKGVSRILAQ
jgi:hypothetical protein